MDLDTRPENSCLIAGMYDFSMFQVVLISSIGNVIRLNFEFTIAFLCSSASGCPIAAKNKGKSGYEGISSLSKYGPSSSGFGPFDQSTEHMMGVDDKDKNRMDTSDPMDEKVI